MENSQRNKLEMNDNLTKYLKLFLINVEYMYTPGETLSRQTLSSHFFLVELGPITFSR